MNNKPVLTPEEIEAMNAVADFMGYSLWNQGMPASNIMRERRAAFIDCFELLWPMVRESYHMGQMHAIDPNNKSFQGVSEYLTSLLNKLKETDGK